VSPRARATRLAFAFATRLAFTFAFAFALAFVDGKAFAAPDAVYRAYADDLRAVNASLPKGTELRVPSPDELQIAPFAQKLLPGIAIYVADGTYNGGHAFFSTRVLVEHGGRVLAARDPSSEEGGPPGIRRALACSPAYLRGIAPLFAGKPHGPIDVAALQKRECLDLTPLLIAAVRKDAAAERVAELVAIVELLNQEEPAYVVSRAEDLDAQLRAILEGRQPLGGRAQSSGKPAALHPIEIERAAGGRLTARGFVVRRHRLSSALESFVLKIDDKGLLIVGEMIARFDGFIE